jgi:hypothetical protein
MFKLQNYLNGKKSLQDLILEESAIIKIALHLKKFLGFNLRPLILNLLRTFCPKLYVHFTLAIKDLMM